MCVMKNKILILIVGILSIACVILFWQKKDQPATSDVQNDQLLSGFEELGVWGISPEKGFDLGLSDSFVSQGKKSLKVKFPTGGLPSINTKKLKHHWGAYDYLAVDVFNPGKSTVNLVIRLDDKDGGRVNIKKMLNPNINNIKISREEIASQIDSENINFIVLFLDQPKEREVLYFDNLRLEGNGKSLQEKQMIRKYEENSKPMPVRKAVALPVKPVNQKGKIKAAVARLKETPGKKILVSSGIPFSQGQLMSEKNLSIKNMQNQTIPIATKVLSRWPKDRSIKSVLVQFPFDVEQLYEYVWVEWGEPRQIQDLVIQEPNWRIPEGFIVMPAQWMCDSQAFGSLVPMGQSILSKYDERAQQYFTIVRDQQKTGNLAKDGYYSTAHTFYLLFARSGELKYLQAARDELLYYRENEIQWEGSNKGGAKSGGKGLYVYVQAMMDDYYLFGDERSLSAAKNMADYLLKLVKPSMGYYSKNESGFWTERLMAFSFLGGITYYEMSLDEKYLKASKEYMENVYKTQLEWPSRGGFIHNLYAHDPEEGARRDEYGGSPFMTGLLLEAIIKYHQATGDDMAADSVFRAVDWLIKEGLVSSRDSFKYLTADRYLSSSGDPDVNLLVVHAFGYAFLLSGYQENQYLEIGQKVFERGVKEAYLKKQKHFNQNYRSSGYYLGYIKNGLPIYNQTSAHRKENADNDYIFETFDFSVGQFTADKQTQLTIDTTVFNRIDKVLRITSNDRGWTFDASLKLPQWNISHFQELTFDYAVAKDSSVGIMAKTTFGDSICLAGTREFICPTVKTKGYAMIDDDEQWHHFKMNVNQEITQLLPALKFLDGISFVNNDETQQKEGIWLDNVRIGIGRVNQ